MSEDYDWDDDGDEVWGEDEDEVWGGSEEWGSQDEYESEGPMDGGMTRSKSYEVLSPTEIEARADNLAEECANWLGASDKSVIYTLLRSFKWSKEFLVESYMADSKAALKRADLKSLKPEKKSKRKGEMECPICIMDCPINETFALSCGHRFCVDCWSGYLQIHAKDEGFKCTNTTCMRPKCPNIVHKGAWERLADKDTYDRYLSFLHRSFVEENPHAKWCPWPSCDNALVAESASRSRPVECTCGFRWCFRCADHEVGDHMPASCNAVEAWKEKEVNESENVNWMVANTKRCPKCKNSIEKNGGCMHMTCRCGHDFCWLCRGPWSEHGSHTGGYYACNKYDKSDAKKEDEKADEARGELEHYMFYYHRFTSHKDALRVAREQKENTHEKKLFLIEKYSLREVDCRTVDKVTEQLVNNRSVLQWSYCHGYYLSVQSRTDDKKITEKNLFEYLQEDLEKHTNYLSELYEREESKMPFYEDFIAWRGECENYSRVCQSFLQNFIEGVIGGLTEKKKRQLGDSLGASWG